MNPASYELKPSASKLADVALNITLRDRTVEYCTFLYIYRLLAIKWWELVLTNLGADIVIDLDL